MAVAALQTLARFLLHQRLFAHRANQDFKKLWGNHVGILRPNQVARCQFPVPTGPALSTNDSWKLETKNHSIKLDP